MLAANKVVSHMLDKQELFALTARLRRRFPMSTELWLLCKDAEERALAPPEVSGYDPAKRREYMREYMRKYRELKRG
jgi:hypothetical protein